MLRPSASRQTISPSRMASLTRNSNRNRGKTLVRVVLPRDEFALAVSDISNGSKPVVLQANKTCNHPLLSQFREYFIRARGSRTARSATSRSPLRCPRVYLWNPMLFMVRFPFTPDGVHPKSVGEQRQPDGPADDSQGALLGRSRRSQAADRGVLLKQGPFSGGHGWPRKSTVIQSCGKRPYYNRQ
jgi:hypothetical protein